VLIDRPNGGKDRKADPLGKMIKRKKGGEGGGATMNFMSKGTIQSPPMCKRGKGRERFLFEPSANLGRMALLCDSERKGGGYWPQVLEGGEKEKEIFPVHLMAANRYADLSGDQKGKKEGKRKAEFFFRVAGGKGGRGGALPLLRRVKGLHFLPSRG